MPVLAYSSLGRGFFSGRVTPENFEEAKGSLDKACLTAYCHDVNFRRLERAMSLAEQKGATVPQIALAYILRSPLNVFPLIGAATGEEFAQNLAALDLLLSDAERAWLNLEQERAPHPGCIKTGFEALAGSISIFHTNRLKPRNRNMSVC